MDIVATFKKISFFILSDDMMCNNQMGEIFELWPRFEIVFNFKTSAYFKLCTFYLFDYNTEGPYLCWIV